MACPVCGDGSVTPRSCAPSGHGRWSRPASTWPRTSRASRNPATISPAARWTSVLRDDHSAPEHHPDRALFLCWPSYAEPWAAQSLACYTGDLLIYCGEGEGGCTADDEFFHLLEAEWEEIGNSPAHIAYRGIHDYLTAYRRKP
jgi:hypothetical protein